MEDEATGQELGFSVAEPGYAGSKVEVDLPDSSSKVCKVAIAYATSSSSSALQWLSPEQTAGKTHPYLFSQVEFLLYLCSLFSAPDFNQRAVLVPVHPLPLHGSPAGHPICQEYLLSNGKAGGGGCSSLVLCVQYKDFLVDHCPC